mgnify:CR=1 FL=1
MMSTAAKPLLTEAVMFFSERGISKEMLFPEFEALLDGLVASPEFADETVEAVFLQINARLQVRAAVFFTLDFDLDGYVNRLWNMPLRQIAERAERTGEPCEPSVQSVQSVPMPGEEEEDLINLGVAAWRRRGHAVQWRRGAACHQSGGAACHQPPRPPLVAARPGRPPADSGTGLFTVCTVVIVGVGHLGRLRFLDSDGSPPPLPLPLPGWLPAFCPCVVEFKPDLERF